MRSAVELALKVGRGTRLVVAAEHKKFNTSGSETILQQERGPP
jgi:hypothetical protein